MRADIDAARAALPKEGERIVDKDGPPMTVAWCSGWTWPLGEPIPTVFYAQPLVAGRLEAIELRVIPAHDDAGRYWLAERRA